MLEVFLRESEVDRCTTLRQVICSGEALSYELRQRFFDRSSAALHNLYGPTEASIDVTAWECRRDSDRSVVPIGRPIANTQIYILDPLLNPVPIGVVGELHIGGIGLARGYLNRRELTAQQFVPNPFSDQPGARLYKTGDLARYLPDGNIEFLGRIDNQVKIRGFRIELGEIEFVLAQHPAIRQAVLLAREDAPDDTRLVAYMVATAGSSPSADDLRSFLQHKLPDYMVPSAFVFLDSLPLTPNGKLDRKALPAPDHSRPELDDAFVAPRNPVEAILANIWAEVLKLEKVGIRDNFFNLGGHSLLATQVVSRMRNAFSIDVPLRQIFDAPTIAEMAAIITENQVKRAKASSGAPRDRFDD
jgi:acyl-coenzyme A synthetase/AMP-(fatty) acid ligase/acyl carrier protein